ncbi:MAG: hydrogenase iron-sulfur subunit, partial [Chloroflexi bacterium]|nr:hydrogenase iron-sulfur subunit [Chloroflexota bacterium]
MSEINPPAAPAADQNPVVTKTEVIEPQRHEEPVEAVPAGEDPIIVGFLCEWAADLNDTLDESGVVRGMPNVRVIKIPCSGMTKPAWMEMA